ncbi:hypothetical protein SNE40_019958 [Patella caerulea]|uniref:Uncharacterized protein n=1 Tax=Patella caerulea TaxID=87958 RepID=A0AAN8GDN0_PATCE
MEKENQVKYLKELIRGLGPWKTEDNISRITKAGPVVQLVSDNFDSLLDVKGYSTTHKVKSSEEDLKAIQKELTELQPFNKTPGRTLDAFSGISKDPFEGVNRTKFKSDIEIIINRILRNIPTDNQSEII